MNRPDLDLIESFSYVSRDECAELIAYARYLEHKIELVKDDAEVDRERVKMTRQRVAELESALGPFTKMYQAYTYPEDSPYHRAVEVLNRKGA